MRITRFQSIYEDIVRRHGLDPTGDAITYDTARAIAERINQRVRMAFEAWSFPELTLTEERAFRSVWNDTRQLHIGEEIFFIPSVKYYKVRTDLASDLPIGTPPATQAVTGGPWVTNAAFFTDLTLVDSFIEYDQTCKRSIGRALGVYSQNPRTINPRSCQCICL